MQFAPWCHAVQSSFLRKRPRHSVRRRGNRRGIRTLESLENRSVLAGDVAGTLWNDLNINGLKDPEEDGLPNWTVFIDLNEDQQLDVDEPSALTNIDGDYLITGIDTGPTEGASRSVSVREVLPAGWRPTVGYADSRVVEVIDQDETKVDFGNVTVQEGTIAGVVWHDHDGDGLRAIDPVTNAFTDEGLSGRTIFLDLDRNREWNAPEPSVITAADGSFVMTGITAGSYRIQEIIPTGWDTPDGFDNNLDVTVFTGVTSHVEFANLQLDVAHIRGTVWNDLDGNGLRAVDATAGGFTEPGIEGWQVFDDINGNQLLDLGEASSLTDAQGNYTLFPVTYGQHTIVEVPRSDWRATAPVSGTLNVFVLNGQDLQGVDFGNYQRQDATIRGVIFADADHDGTRDVGERGLAGITIYLDLDDDGTLDAGEPSVITSDDLYFTPVVDESGSYRFERLAAGSYTVREIVPDRLSATPHDEAIQHVAVAGADDAVIDVGNVYRPSEIHGVKFADVNGNHLRDEGEPAMPGVTIFIDLDRDNVFDGTEPSTLTADDGSYAFTSLTPGAYVIREVDVAGFERTFPLTTGGTLWPTGVSHPAVGQVTPQELTASLAIGETYSTSISLTLPGTGALTNLVDVFLLFDDTGSFVDNSPIVRAAFPNIIAQLQTSLPGIDLGFGVARFEEYANYAQEYSTGRPFVLNQPIVASATTGFAEAIQAALDREAPGYGGDTPETLIEALYQTVTGLGFDGNQNGSVLDSGRAGAVATQVTPGDSGDVPSFASFMADATGPVLAPAGTLGGAGFRAGALPIILAATDTGFAYQPQGESTISGVGGVNLPLASLTESARADTPFASGAGIQQTITGLNALGALVIGLGTNAEPNFDPRQDLESLATLTGATNQSTTTIDNGTTDPIAPGDPLYFQISSAAGLANTVAAGVVNAIENAVTHVAYSIELKASDPRVHITSTPSVRHGIGAGQTATFDVTFTGDGIPHRFDLQFVRAGTNVVLGSIPVVLGTPIPGDGYEFEDLEDGEIGTQLDFGNHALSAVVPNQAPSFAAGPSLTTTEDSGPQTVVGWATSIQAGPNSEAAQLVDFRVEVGNPALFAVLPSITSDGTLTYTSAADAYGSTTLSIVLHDNGGTDNGGMDASAPQVVELSIVSVNDAPISVDDSFTTSEDTLLTGSVLANDTDIDSSTLTARLAMAPTHGTLAWQGDGSFTYMPAANYAGLDSFDYVVSDGTLESNIAHVAILIEAVNDAPVGVADRFATNQATELRGNVVTNDLDIDGDLLSATIVSSSQHGVLTLSVSGDFVYVPVAGYRGPDVFEYKVSDGTATSGPIQVSIDVLGVDPPVGDKFFVVDGSVRDMFRYDGTGTATGANSLHRRDQSPRGIASNADGSLKWVIDESTVVYVYDASGATVGSWTARGVDEAQGITVAGGNVWIVDAHRDQLLAYAGGASRRSGAALPTTRLNLHRDNHDPTDVVSDGNSLWVLNNTRTLDEVFRYSLTGAFQGRWRIDARNTQPTGITLDPNQVNHLWIVDATADRVFQYDGATGRVSGQQSASTSFALAARNRNPQGIADPRSLVAVDRAFADWDDEATNESTRIADAPSAEGPSDDRCEVSGDWSDAIVDVEHDPRSSLRGTRHRTAT